jgi:hypothetical protein
MKKKLYKDLILVLIFFSKGKWSWYQLARELEWRGLGGQIKVTDIIDQLISEKLVIEKTDSIAGIGTPYCFVTSAGADKVHELVNEFGIEAFTRKQENKDDYE